MTGRWTVTDQLTRGFEAFAVVDDDPLGHQEVYLRKLLER